MPFVTDGSRRIGRTLAAAIGLALLSAGPASASTAEARALKAFPANPDGCAVGGTVTTPFTAWDDFAGYELAPGGDFETGAAGWTLEDGAAVVEGNEPWQVGGEADAASLALPAGSSAVTAPMCIGVAHPTLRFFARNTGSSLSSLSVAVVYRDLLGTPRSLTVGVIGAGDAWAPTPVLPVVVNLLSLVGGDQEVAFRFKPLRSGGEWTIDDVFVDPYKKG